MSSDVMFEGGGGGGYTVRVISAGRALETMMSLSITLYFEITPLTVMNQRVGDRPLCV